MNFIINILQNNLFCHIVPATSSRSTSSSACGSWGCKHLHSAATDDGGWEDCHPNHTTGTKISIPEDQKSEDYLVKFVTSKRSWYKNWVFNLVITILYNYHLYSSSKIKTWCQSTAHKIPTVSADAYPCQRFKYITWQSMFDIPVMIYHALYCLFKIVFTISFYT